MLAVDIIAGNPMKQRGGAPVQDATCRRARGGSELASELRVSRMNEETRPKPLASVCLFQPHLTHGTVAE